MEADERPVPAAGEAGGKGQSDPERWVDDYGDMLYRYALARVSRPDVAQELVQETFLAALKGRARFAGRSTERTWLTGILRHKILDHYRSRSRGPAETPLDGHDDPLAVFFDEEGRWINPPDAIAVNPQDLLQQEEFWAVLDRCLDGLSQRRREAFVRRVMEGEDTGTICKALGITATNLWVILYRARTQMRRCLTVNWFDAGGSFKDSAIS